MGNLSMALRHYVTSVNIKKLSRLLGYLASEDPAGDGSFIAFSHSSWNKLIILMADCNSEIIVFMKHM